MSLASANDALMRPRHVPAWKRIGLKLKYAKDPAEHHSSQQERQRTTAIEAVSSPNPHRNWTNRSDDDVRPAKKRKKSSDFAGGKKDSTGDSVAPLNPAETTSEPPSIGSEHVRTSTESISVQSDQKVDNSSLRQASATDDTTPIQGLGREPDRRKSVTFTPETKQADGYSAISSSRPSGVDQQPAVAGSSIQLAATLPKKTKKAKQPRDKPETPTSVSQHEEPKAPDGQREPLEYVRYLHSFHTDKRSWKFNKNKQKDLLNNLFKIDRIPSQHNAAILEYIAGLQGAAACERLVESATSVLKSIAEKHSTDPLPNMESEEARRASYRVALQRQIERYEQSGAGSSEYDDRALEETRQEIESGKRADAVLTQLLQQELSPPQARQEINKIVPTATPTPDTGGNSRISEPAAANRPVSKTPKRNKRKSRTQASSDESSSDNDTFKPSRGPATLHEALKARPSLPLNGQAEKVSVLKASTGKKIVFDDDFLDKFYPKQKNNHDTARTKSGRQA